MSDRSAAEIAFGGPITADELRELQDLLESHGLTPGGFESPFADDRTAAAHMTLDDTPVFHDCEVSGGMFCEIEEWCWQHEVHYDRMTYGCYVWPPEIVFYRGGLPRAFHATDNGEVLIPETTLCRLLDTKLRDPSELYGELKKLLPGRSIPNLEPLRLVDHKEIEHANKTG